MNTQKETSTANYVLAVENDEMSRLLMTLILKKNNVKHELANTSTDALKKLQQAHYSMLVFGIGSPDEKAEPGFEELMVACKRSGIPAIAISGTSDNEETGKYLINGFSTVLPKPYYEDELIKAINAYKSQKTKKDVRSFSLDQLNRIGNCDDEFIIKMLEKFILSVSECSEIMASALFEGDWIKIKTAAHKSIPSYSLMGLNDLMEELEFIEAHAGNSGADPDLVRRVKWVEEKNKEIVQDIREHLEQMQCRRNN